jgi:hypothetical protein
MERADLRQCLQSHIEGLLVVVNTNSSLGRKDKSQLVKEVNGIDQDVTEKLDHMEQAVRDLLQIVRYLAKTLLQALTSTP